LAREVLEIGLGLLKGALLPAARAARRNQAAREVEFDCAHGVDTAGMVLLYTLDGFVGLHRDEGCHYESVNPERFRERIAALGIDFPQYTFLDLGCGKGRTLLIAAQFPFRRVRGVEFAPALHAVAEKNIAADRGPRRCGDIRADLADAAEYPVPDGPLVVFMYNPFFGSVMDRVLANLAQSHREQPRDIKVVYWNPVHAALFGRHRFTRIADLPEAAIFIL
jgi:SAM-dependent methyltransferase